MPTAVAVSLCGLARQDFAKFRPRQNILTLHDNAAELLLEQYSSISLSTPHDGEFRPALGIALPFLAKPCLS
jgi:hypothetical protein